MDPRCVKCGRGIEKLYIQYSPGNIRLLKCGDCKSVADEYIECDLLILIIDLILHKPQAYRHLLFNVLRCKNLDFDTLLFKSSFFFLLLDAYKLWILNGTSEERSVLSLGWKTLGCSLLENLAFFCVFAVFSKRYLTFVEGFSGYKDVLLTMVVSSYLKIYMLSMLVWEFPTSVVYIVDLFVMSSNLVALRVISKSSFTRCVGLCLGAHALKFFVHWMLK
ncbi:protein arv1 homolog [Chenopodium quinoa]|uniref:Protein ARV n=1 Tax=Chenopodium quinoa TaxID=63459 RepID=A0A803LP64_CHEQI|nr:protein arv1 homolog [Chenopodium quinoa]XP_021738621.1 protein arv1 homolog [Chenopodium quinoa]